MEDLDHPDEAQLETDHALMNQRKASEKQPWLGLLVFGLLFLFAGTGRRVSWFLKWDPRFTTAH